MGQVLSTYPRQSPWEDVDGVWRVDDTIRTDVAHTHRSKVVKCVLALMEQIKPEIEERPRLESAHAQDEIVEPPAVDLKQPLQPGDFFPLYPLICEVISDASSVPVDDFTLGLIDAVNEVTDMLLTAIENDQSHLTQVLRAEQRRLLDHIESNLEIAREFDIKRRIFNLQRKYSHFGRKLFTSPWKRPKSAEDGKFLCAGFRRVLLCGRRRKLKILRVPVVSKVTASNHHKGVIYLRQIDSIRSLIHSRIPRWAKVDGAVIARLTTQIIAKALQEAKGPPPKYMKSTGVDLKVFHLFRDLPPELQLRIWHLARPEPQIIQLRQKRNLPDGDNDENPYTGMYRTEYHKSFTKTPIPGLVHACFDSRDYALKRWFTSTFPNKIGPDLYFHGLTFFLDLERDFLYLGCKDCNMSFRSDWCCGRLPWSVEHKVKRVIVQSAADRNPMIGLMRYKNVEEIVFLKSDHPHLLPGTRFEDLQEVVHVFEWQSHDQGLADAHADTVKKWNEQQRSRYVVNMARFREDWPAALAELTSQGHSEFEISLAKIGRMPSEPEPTVDVKKIWVAELVPNVSTTKTYGFMKEFFNETFFF